VQPQIRGPTQHSRSSFATILIGHTTTSTGLRVDAKLDKRRYKTGRVVTRAQGVRGDK